MPEEKLKILHDSLGKEFDLGSFEDFRSKMSNPEKQRLFFDGVSQTHDLGTFEEFSGKISLDNQAPAQDIGLLDALGQKLGTPILGQADPETGIAKPGAFSGLDFLLNVLDLPVRSLSAALPSENPDETFAQALARNKPLLENLDLESSDGVVLSGPGATPAFDKDGSVKTQEISAKDKEATINLWAEMGVDVLGGLGLAKAFKGLKGLSKSKQEALKQGIESGNEQAIKDALPDDTDLTPEEILNAKKPTKESENLRQAQPDQESDLVDESAGVKDKNQDEVEGKTDLEAPVEAPRTPSVRNNDLEASKDIPKEETPSTVKKEEEALTPEFVTGIKHKIVTEERKLRGLEELQVRGRRDWGKVWDEATENIKSGKTVPRELSKELSENPRPITDTEAATLDYERVSLNTIHREITDAIGKSKNVDESITLKQNLLEVEDALNTNDIAAKQSGTETARGLAARRAMVKNDYTLASVVQQARNANKGEAISDVTRTKLEKLTKELEDTQKRLKEFEESGARAEAKEALETIKRDARKQKRQAKKVDLDAEYENLTKQFAETANDLNALVNPKQTALLSKMAVNRVRAGVNTVEQLVDDLYGVAKDHIKDLTKRDVRDAISGYGRYTPLRKDEIRKKLADIREQGRLISAIEDIEAGQKPLKSGFERRPSSNKAKALKEKLNKLRKESGFDTESRLKAYKTRLENEQKKLKQMIQDGDFQKPVPRRKLQLDSEAERLKAQVYKLKRQVNTEIALIERKNRPLKQKIIEGAVDIANIPRSLISSLDLSATLRQGGFLLPGHSREHFNAFKQQLKFMRSEEFIDRLTIEIAESPNSVLYDKSGLFLANKEGNKFKMAQREERFLSQFAESIPGIGRLVKGSERAYTGFLDKLRMDVFDDVAGQYTRAGLSFEKNPEVFKALGDYINAATGRGDLGVTLNRIAPLLNGVFFSPRLIASRLNILNPVFYAKLPQEVRIQALKDAAKFVGAGMSILTLAKLGGAEVEIDPRSSDFGKIRIGNLRMDIWGGFQQFVVLFSRLISGQQKSVGSGEVRDLDGEKFPFTTRKDLLHRFTEQKFSPSAAFVRDLLSNSDFMGNDLTLEQQAINLTIPLYMRDVYKAGREMGYEGLLLTAPGFFGVGTQLFDSKKKNNAVKPKKKKRTRRKKLGTIK